MQAVCLIARDWSRNLSVNVSEVIKQVGGFPTRGYAGDTIGTYIIDYGTVRFEMGYACTLSVVLFLIMVLTNNIITKLLRKNLND